MITAYKAILFSSFLMLKDVSSPKKEKFKRKDNIDKLNKLSDPLLSKLSTILSQQDQKVCFSTGIAPDILYDKAREYISASF